MQLANHYTVTAVIFVLCTSALAFQCCGVEAASTAVTVTPTGYDIASPDPSIAWIDNNQVLFVGIKSNPDSKKGSFGTGKMYIWNESTKSAREYADGTSFCYANGWIRYGSGKKDEAGNRIVHAGPLGKEEVVKVSPVPPTRRSASNMFSCKPYFPDDFVPPFPKGRERLVLREGDGYLTLRPNDPKEYMAYPRNITLYREKGASPVTLPITWEEDVGVWDPFYSDYLGAYVLHPQKFISGKGPREWPVTELRVVYILYATSGKLERILLPKADGFYRPRPIRDGWIHGGGNFYKTAGLYINKSDVISKLDAGSISQIVISPDGCRAAVAINNWHLYMGTPTTIKIFNFCHERK